MPDGLKLQTIRLGGKLFILTGSMSGDHNPQRGQIQVGSSPTCLGMTVPSTSAPWR